MARPATSRLKVNPPLGRMPVLQFLRPEELAIDSSYQRSIESGDSQALIRRIAQHWNWDLCLPLVVARRADGALYVIDGQHRLAAARLRRDIQMLPSVVVEYASAADEAASFVHLNQQRRPLGKLDLFKAAVASGDPQACAILEAMKDAGLSVAPHLTAAAWKPGMIGNIGGIESAWRNAGPTAATEALHALATAFAGEVLRYAGTIFPGIVAVCAEECRGREDFAPARFATFTAKLGTIGQEALRKQIVATTAERHDLGRVQAAVKVVTEVWWPDRKGIARSIAPAPAPAPVKPTPAPTPPALPVNFVAGEDRKCWCDQCEMRVTMDQAKGCRSRWCSLKARA